MAQMSRARKREAVDKDPLTMDDLVLIAQGHVAFQLLWAGHKLDLFLLLSREPGLTLEDVAKRILKGRVRPARILLAGLAALNVIRKIGDGYHNARLTEEMLVPDRPRSIAPVLGWQAMIVYPGLQDFVASLEANENVGLNRFEGTEKTLYQRLARDRKLEHVFQEAMSALSAQGNADLVAIAPLDGAKHVVDVGGGNGSNAIAMARRFPRLRATVFDSPSVCGLAQRNIEQAGLAGRIDTCPGDMFVDPLPQGVDAILFAHMFTIWSPDNALKLLKKSYAALPDGGKFLMFNMMANDDGHGPLSTALGSPYFLAVATGEGMLYSWRDYETWIREAGFGKVERFEGLPLDHGLLVATK